MNVGLGNITESAPAKSERQRLEARQHRYDMQAKAADILKDSRVAICQKIPSYGAQQSGAARGISVNANGRAHFHGVGSCGDVWACPVCSQRVSETRRQEILTALGAHRAAGGIAIMVSWTFSHAKSDDLAELVPKFCKALSELKGRRVFKRVKDQLGYIGQIRALEVTHGNANGWHPHAHEIWFLQRDHITELELKTIQAELFTAWEHYAVKNGLGKPSAERGLDIKFREGEQGEILAVGSYVAKWGHELTYAHMKRGKNGSRSPWAILDDVTRKYTYRDARLFREYAQAFKGRAQLFWSRGLKALFDIDNQDDETLADKPEVIHVTDLDNEQWRAIIGADARALVLWVAEKDPLFLQVVLDDLVHQARDTERRQWQRRRAIYTSTQAHIRALGLDWAL